MDNKPIEGKDIIIVGQQAWDVEIGSNCKNIALELSKYNRVLYINPPLDRITKIRSSKDPKIRKRINIIKGKEKGLLKIKENLWNFYPNVLIESINWIKNQFVFSLLNKRNNRLFASSIQNAIRELKFSNYILFNDNDIFRSFHLKELLNPIISIYYSRDNIVATDYWKRHGVLLEPKLIEKSDICVSNSEYLRNYCLKYNSNSYFVGQGCDFEIFMGNDFSSPKELEHVSAPIIGYVGVLTSLRLDISIIEYIAKTVPEWNIVLVGPEDGVFEGSILHTLKNVFFLGAQKPESLPAFINCFDVSINPQIINELTIGNYPRKIDEYLAMGKPVVATMTEAMLSFKDYVSLASSNEEFVQMIEEALMSDNDELRMRRKKFASSHSWENSVLEISKVVDKYLSANQ